MCSTLGQMFMVCGIAPMVEYALMGAGLMALVAWFVRP